MQRTNGTHEKYSGQITNMWYDQYTCSVVKLKIKFHSFFSFLWNVLWMHFKWMCMSKRDCFLLYLIHRTLAHWLLLVWTLFWRYRKPNINNIEYFGKKNSNLLLYFCLFLHSIHFFICWLFFSLILNVNLQLFIVKVKLSIKFIDWDFGALSRTLWQSQLLVNYQNENFKLNFVHLLSMKS